MVAVVVAAVVVIIIAGCRVFDRGQESQSSKDEATSRMNWQGRQTNAGVSPWLAQMRRHGRVHCLFLDKVPRLNAETGKGPSGLVDNLFSFFFRLNRLTRLPFVKQ
ncbi:hypothetical protein BD289DRAFT_439890 [Coniella lustricola]|uniref:Uncharacterized protein n=1 Tax=Coniella lustricola TaxID=2025994 RepID=A0A2T3A112_9PEZI|nr:hypothetical protein BD289DRAFT_439890 [Coniella lustricola]